MELTLFIAIAAFVAAIAGVWSCAFALKSHKAAIGRLQAEVGYLQYVLNYNEIFLPNVADTGCVYVDDDEVIYDEEKTFLQEGNVVYLQDK